MRVFKCDGIHEETKAQCPSTYYPEPNESYPKGWLLIYGTIKNDLPNSTTHEELSKQELHFCSRSCISHYLFKTEPNTEPIKERSY